MPQYQQDTRNNFFFTIFCVSISLDYPGVMLYYIEKNIIGSNGSRHRIIEKGAIIVNIGQIARSQQMLYKIANKNMDVSSSGYSSKSTGRSSSKLSDSGLLNVQGSAVQDAGNNFFSSPAALKGSVRQIARRLYDASFSSDTTGTSSAQAENPVGGDEILNTIREQLGAKVESQQQLYQPDKATLTGNFEQLQAVAESLVNRLQTVTLSDETTKKIQELALEDAKSSAGVQEGGETDVANTPVLSRMDYLNIIQEEVQKFAPSKRAAAFNTMNKVWEDELERIGTHIKEKDPNWTIWGDKFDVSILDDYKAGINIWV